ncbi:MAG: ACP S-malonyltransferase [Blastochloris viridis]|uniref:Malonyl CoA-acyl carrier protein transacylase n=1 Tax=Blastochloris viridis TaxID=1079 RepID=A0A6N4R8H6_BLAVI|nr:MAG: ACP S-malonyltransferase [Blastochloris viridis]
MKKLSLVFPGQGSQVPGMGKDFAEEAFAKELFEQADDALGFGLTKLMWGEDAAVLTQTENAQPALLVTGLVALEYLKCQSGKSVAEMAAFVAGHSLGEYTAVAAAGGMDFETAVKLVRLRGEAMRDCGDTLSSRGSMSAILGLEADVADKVARESGVVFANDNSPGQAIFSGPVVALEKAEEAAKAAGAKRALRLNVSGPFHTPVMTGAAGEVRDFLKSHPLRDLSVPCVMNVKATGVQAAAEVTEGLVAQVTERVRWRETMMFMAEQGVEQVVELGVGKVLTGMASRCDARLSGVSLSNRAEVDAWVATL